MYKIKTNEIFASDIAQYLNLPLHGEDVTLRSPWALRPHGLASGLGDSVGEAYLAILGPGDPADHPSYLVSPSVDRDVARVLLEYFATSEARGIDPSARVDPGAVLGRNVAVGPHSVIGDRVELGDGVTVGANVVITGPAVVGRNSVIKDGAVIGSEGYGFVADEEGRWVHAPQLGRVQIGQRVWIGSNSTVERGLLGETRIEDEVKIDDLVHVGQGSTIGAGSLLTAGCVLAYRVRMGRGVRVGPQVSIRESLDIADGVIIGQGAVVIDSLRVAGTYVGVPAHRLHD